MGFWIAALALALCLADVPTEQAYRMEDLNFHSNSDEPLQFGTTSGIEILDSQKHRQAKIRLQNKEMQQLQPYLDFEDQISASYSLQNATLIQLYLDPSDATYIVSSDRVQPNHLVVQLKDKVQQFVLHILLLKGDFREINIHDTLVATIAAGGNLQFVVFLAKPKQLPHKLPSQSETTVNQQIAEGLKFLEFNQQKVEAIIKHSYDHNVNGIWYQNAREVEGTEKVNLFFPKSCSFSDRLLQIQQFQIMVIIRKCQQRFEKHLFFLWPVKNHEKHLFENEIIEREMLKFQVTVKAEEPLMLLRLGYSSNTDQDNYQQLVRLIDMVNYNPRGYMEVLTQTRQDDHVTIQIFENCCCSQDQESTWNFEGSNFNVKVSKKKQMQQRQEVVKRQSVTWEHYAEHYVEKKQEASKERAFIPAKKAEPKKVPEKECEGPPMQQIAQKAEEAKIEYQEEWRKNQVIEHEEKKQEEKTEVEVKAQTQAQAPVQECKPPLEYKDWAQQVNQNSQAAAQEKVQQKRTLDVQKVNYKEFAKQESLKSCSNANVKEQEVQAEEKLEEKVQQKTEEKVEKKVEAKVEAKVEEKVEQKQQDQQDCKVDQVKKRSNDYKEYARQQQRESGAVVSEQDVAPKKQVEECSAGEKQQGQIKQESAQEFKKEEKQEFSQEKKQEVKLESKQEFQQKEKAIQQEQQQENQKEQKQQLQKHEEVSSDEEQCSQYERKEETQQRSQQVQSLENGHEIKYEENEKQSQKEEATQKANVQEPEETCPPPPPPLPVVQKKEECDENPYGLKEIEREEDNIDRVQDDQKFGGLRLDTDDGYQSPYKKTNNGFPVQELNVQQPTRQGESQGLNQGELQSKQVSNQQQPQSQPEQLKPIQQQPQQQQSQQQPQIQPQQPAQNPAQFNQYSVVAPFSKTQQNPQVGQTEQLLYPTAISNPIQQRQLLDSQPNILQQPNEQWQQYQSQQQQQQPQQYTSGQQQIQFQNQQQMQQTQQNQIYQQPYSPQLQPQIQNLPYQQTKQQQVPTINQQPPIQAQFQGQQLPQNNYQYPQYTQLQPQTQQVNQQLSSYPQNQYIPQQQSFAYSPQYPQEIIVDRIVMLDEQDEAIPVVAVETIDNNYQYQYFKNEMNLRHSHRGRTKQ